MLTSSTSTGHLRMFQVVTAAGPMPTRSPAHSATGPVNTTMKALMIIMTPMTAVVTNRIGMVFQNGRPSGTS